MRASTRFGAVLALAALAACGGGGKSPGPAPKGPTAARGTASRPARAGWASLPTPLVVEETLLDDGFGGLYVNGWMELGAYAGSVALGLEENTSGPNWAIGSFPKWIVTQGCVAIHDRLGVPFGDPTPPDWCVDLSGRYQRSVPAGLPRTGTLELRDALQLQPGTYRLTFELGPPQNPGVLGADRCVVSLDDHFRETFTMAYTDPWRTVSRYIRVCEPGTAKIRFAQTGPRNLHQPDPLQTMYYVNWGCRIDNVRFDRMAEDLALATIEPSFGGNVGSVRTTISGSGFPGGPVTAVLRGVGVPEIAASASTVQCGASATATFDLRGAASGARDVVLLFAGGLSATLPAGFVVEEGGGPEPWVSLTGASSVRAGRLARYGVLVTNRGNVDSEPDTILSIRPPAGTTDAVVRTEGESIPLASDVPGGGGKPVLSGLALAPPLNAATGAFTLFSLPPSGSRALELEARFSASGSVTVTLHRPLSPSPPAKGLLWRRFLHRKAEELAGEPARTFGALAEEVITATWASVVDGAQAWLWSQASSRNSAALISPVVRESGVPAGATPVSAALCQEGLDHFRDWFSSSEFALWTSVCVLERLREAYFENTSEPLHSELAEAVTYYDRVNRELLLRRPEMASLSVDNWHADSLMRNVQRLTQGVLVVQSSDPNQKLGCSGFGPAHAVSIGEALQYKIEFENVPSATAAAATVEITDFLDTSLVDPGTVRFHGVGFGSHSVATVQKGAQFNAMVDVRPSQDLLVSVEGQVDVATGRIRWKFTTLDPATGREPTDPLLGFLPPNQQAPEGEGYVTFSVMPRGAAGTQAVIRNKASIVFDFNTAIETPEWINTVDGGAPRSTASASAPAPGATGIPVSWSGSDDASGILDYRVYVAEDGGPYTLWQGYVPSGSAVFEGTPGHTYRFYSVARDQTGNLESKTGFDAEVALASAPSGEGGGGAVGWEALVLAAGALGRALVVARRRGARGRAS